MVQMFREIPRVLRRDNLLVHITKTSRQIRQCPTWSPTSTSNVQARPQTGLSVQNKNHVAWTLVQFIRLTGFISCSRLFKFENVHVFIGQIIGPAAAWSAGRVPTPMRFNWNFARLIAPVVTTTSIILSFNKTS